MLALGIIVLIAGILLIVADAHTRRSIRREEQASLQGENQTLTARIAAVESQFPQALVMMDARGLIRRVNPAAESLFGYREEELLGNNILQLLPLAPSASNPAVPRLAQEGTQGAAMEVRCKDKSMVKVRMTGTRSESANHSDFYMFFETPPSSAPHPPLALVERVVGRITGKFEELLTTINGYGELALHAAPEQSMLRQHLEEIVAAGEQASHLARNLLAFSGNQLIPLEPVDLNTVAQDAAHEMQEPRVNVDLPAEAPLALANRECLQQVIRLLAESAGFRIAGKSGNVRIHTRRTVLDRPRAVYSGEVPAGTYGVIAVSDSGTSLRAEVLEHMFEPMYLNPPLLSVDLSPIYGIVTSLGGRLHVESDDNHGTTFEIWLPLAGGQTETEGSRSRGAVANG